MPAGAEFSGELFVYSFYEERDYELFRVVLEALKLVEDDYLGGQGSRGSGKVHFSKLSLYGRSTADYRLKIPIIEEGERVSSIEAVLADQTLIDRIRKAVPLVSKQTT